MVALGIFSLTLVLVLWRPLGLQIGTSALLGAGAALVVGVVSLQDVLEVTHIVWDATLAFLGIILLSLVLDAIGFFEWAALKTARLSRGNGHVMFVGIILLGALVSAFFANDGAALILTPIVLAKMRLLRLDAKALFAFVMAGGFISDTASNPLIISNLTNILTAGFFGIGFKEYALAMFFPNLLAIFASTAVLWLFFRRSIPRTVSTHALPPSHTALKHPRMFRLSWWFLGWLLVGYVVGDWLGLPVSLLALGGALLFLGVASGLNAVNAWAVLREVPWQIIWFSVGLYVVVFGLKNAGLTDTIAELLLWFKGFGHTAHILGTGFLAALLSSLMNNLPAIMVMDIAIQTTGDTFLAYANILGCNLGPKMTPIGSLATLLWLHVLAQKGVKIGWWEYMKVGLVITPPVLLVALLGLV